jgi:hypothetical protein
VATLPKKPDISTRHILNHQKWYFIPERAIPFPTHLKCISVSSSYQHPIRMNLITNMTTNSQTTYLMLPQRLSLQIDNALFRSAILGKPLRNTATV